jgi:putative ABC transport system ATP-binding protein
VGFSKFFKMLELKNITKKYRKGSEIFTALDDISFSVAKGDFLAIIGHSGSGKSTLLNTIGGLVHPDSGEVFYENKDLYQLNNKELNSYRKQRVGFIFQQFHLMPYLTVHENIRLGCHDKTYIKNIDRYLSDCSLTEQKNKFPSELSVGEKQRAAFIRAIISSPELLLADEPTGNLDPENSLVLLDLLREFNRNGGTVLLVSHDPDASRYATSTMKLSKGQIVSMIT